MWNFRFTALILAVLLSLANSAPADTGSSANGDKSMTVSVPDDAAKSEDDKSASAPESASSAELLANSAPANTGSPANGDKSISASAPADDAAKSQDDKSAYSAPESASSAEDEDMGKKKTKADTLRKSIMSELSLLGSFITPVTPTAPPPVVSAPDAYWPFYSKYQYQYMPYRYNGASSLGSSYVAIPIITTAAKWNAMTSPSRPYYNIYNKGQRVYNSEPVNKQFGENPSIYETADNESSDDSDRFDLMLENEQRLDNIRKMLKEWGKLILGNSSASEQAPKAAEERKESFNVPESIEMNTETGPKDPNALGLFIKSQVKPNLETIEKTPANSPKVN